MARARNIKPGFFTNGDLADCQPLARLLFIGLWGICDREGRLVDKPRDIKAKVLPFDDCNVEELLGELDKSGFIRRYSAEAQTGEVLNLIWVVHFKKHQHIHKDEIASQLPEFTGIRRNPEKPGEPPPILNAERGMMNDELLNAESATEVVPLVKPTKTKARKNDNPPIRLGQFIENCGGFPPVEWANYARDKFGWSDERLNGEYEDFADNFWLTDNCLKYAGGRKADWFATWRGHCKKADQRGGSVPVSRKVGGGFATAFASSVAARYGISPTGSGVGGGDSTQGASKDAGVDFDCEGSRNIPF